MPPANRLTRLYAATMALSEPSLAENALLERIVAEAAELLRARYAALGLIGPDGTLERFVTTGLTREEYERLKDHPPVGRGLLGALLREGRPLRLDDLGADPRSVGFPAGHPPMRSFLGVPLLLGEQVMGRLYTTESTQGAFDEEDEHLALGFAAAASVALGSARRNAALRLAAGRLRSVLDALERGICLTDDDGRIVLANEPLTVLLGLERSPMGQLEADFAGMLAAPDTLLSALALERQQRRSVSTEHLELRGPPARVLRRYGIPCLAPDGTWLGRVAVYADVTRDRELQDQLVAVERLRATGEMASGLAHDFNNLLATILGRLEVMLGQTADRALRENLQAAQRAARDGAATVARMRAYGQPLDAGDFRPVVLEQLVREAIELTQPRWRDQAQREGRTIDVDVQVPPMPPRVRVVGDAAALREMLVNLIFNAVDAMPAGGRLTIGLATAGDGAEVSVRDTGVGMTDAVRRRIFEPFFTTKGAGGSGMGLAMVRKIVAAHGGRIDVESAPGLGTVFRIWLPATEAPDTDDGAAGAGAAGAGPDAAGAPPARIGRVVVIDDQQDVLDTTAMLLRGDGHDVRAFADPRAAMAGIVADPPDLVISDVGMPGMTGWDVARAVHAAHPHLPVVLLTGWGREISPAQRREGGIAAVLAKPVEGTALRQAVDALLQPEERPLRVLLVDDSVAFAAALAMLIGQRGHDVTRVETGAAAIEALQMAAFDLVVVDRGLPDQPAGAVLAAARRAVDRPAVCVVSGSASAAMMEEVPGADLYVEKVRVPERLDDLVHLAGAKRPGA
jgi:signal transduction histidine kinase/DNA-binding response OmpR family regulator